MVSNFDTTVFLWTVDQSFVFSFAINKKPFIMSLGMNVTVFMASRRWFILTRDHRACSRWLFLYWDHGGWWPSFCHLDISWLTAWCPGRRVNWRWSSLSDLVSLKASLKRRPWLTSDDMEMIDGPWLVMIWTAWLVSLKQVILPVAGDWMRDTIYSSRVSRLPSASLSPDHELKLSLMESASWNKMIVVTILIE